MARYYIEEQQSDGRWFIHGGRANLFDAHDDMIRLRRLFSKPPLRIRDVTNPRAQTIVCCDTPA